MAELITYTNKTNSVSLGNPNNEKVRAEDLNEIKAVVNLNSEELAAASIQVGTTQPIGTVTGEPGDLYKQINTITSEYTLWQNVGTVTNDTDWQALTGRIAGVQAGNNLPVVIPVDAGVFNPVAYAFTIDGTLRISTPTDGVLEYTGPKMANTARLHIVSLSGSKVVAGTASLYNFVIRVSRISGGGFVNAGFPLQVQASNTTLGTLTLISPIIGIETGDQYQLFVEGEGHSDDWTMQSMEYVIF